MRGKEVKRYFILLVFIFILMYLTFFVSATNRYCNSCANCTSELLLAAAGDVINLTTSIASASGNCIIFNGKDNVTFNCQNYTNYVQGDNAGIDYGIFLNSSQGSNDNIIKNCNITRFYTGIYLNNSLNNTLSNITSNFNNRSIELYNSSHNNLLNITSINSTGYGIYARGGSNNITLNKISAFYNTIGIFLFASNANTLTNINSSFNSEYGIYVQGNNSVLSNINTRNNSAGIYLYGVINASVNNITCEQNRNYGFSAQYVQNSTIGNISCSYNTDYGIFISSLSSGNNITDVNCSHTSLGAGICFSTSNNNTLRNAITNYNKQQGIYLLTAYNNILTGVVTNNNSQFGVYVSGGNNVFDNLTANLNSLDGIALTYDNNNLSNIIVNSNLYGIVVAGSNNSLNNLTLNSNNYSIYFSGAPMSNTFENLNIWNCSVLCVYLGYSANYNVFSKGKINFSSGDLIDIEVGDYNNFSNLQLFESGSEDINLSTYLSDSYCYDNAAPAIDSCFDLSGSTGCSYFSSSCSWSANGYCEFIEGIDSCFDITSSGACSYLSDCSWNSFYGYCAFQAGLTDCSQVYEENSCNSVSDCSWTTSCEGTISGGCSDISDSNNCEQGSDMDNCIWDNGYCKDYVGLGGVGIFVGECVDIGSSGDCNDGTGELCLYDNGYCKQNYADWRAGEGGFPGGCGDISDITACNTETNNLCYWLDTYDYSLGNIFLNCSYNTTKESVGGGSQLIRKWYYKAYVNDTLGNSLQDFNVTSYNATDSYEFNLTTDITGFTSLAEITDYVTNGSSKSYYSPYTIYADNVSLSGSHNFNASLGNNYMDIFTLSLTNVPPTNPSPILSSADQSNTVNSNLNCYSQITDSNEDKLNASVRWFKNNALNLTVNSNNDYASGTGFTSVLGSGNLTVGDSWKCAMRIYDGTIYSSWINSSALTIIGSSQGGEQEQGGGGGSSVSENYLWRLITPLIAAIMEIKNSKLDIIRIIINVLENVYNASLNVTEIDFSQEISKTGLPSGEAYKEFRIQTKSFNDTNIANVTIEFRVNKTWMEERNKSIEDVGLYRKKDNENTWNPLSTKFLSSDTKYHYFTSLSPGFSTFVVFFGKYECQPGIKRCFNGQSQLCLGNATWLITEKCSFGCDENGDCIKTAPQSIIIYTLVIAVVSIGIIITSYLILTRIFANKKRKGK